MQEIVVTHDVLRATVHRSGPPTCIANDNAHEMIHMGWANGGLSVYRPVITDEVADVLHWTSFPAHRSAVLDVMGSYGSGIYSVSAHAFKVHSHGGVALLSQRTPTKSGEIVTTSELLPPPSAPLDEFRCFGFTSTNRVVLGTQSGRVWDYDLQYGRFNASAISVGSGKGEISRMRVNERGMVVIGTTSGAVLVWDIRSKRLVCEFAATTGGKISEMDVSLELAATCGYSSKGAREPFARVFDIRIQKQLSPVQFVTPVSVRFVPTPYIAGGASSNLLLVSPNGNLRLTDLREAGANDSYGRIQSGAGNIEALAVSCTGRSFSAADSAGHVHFWSTNVNAGWDICDPQALQSQPLPELEHPHPLETDLTSLSHPTQWISDDACASYACPFLPPDTQLLSEFPKGIMDRQLRSFSASLRINSDFLKKVSQKDFVGYIPNTEGLNGQALLFGKDQHDIAYIDADPREAPRGQRGAQSRPNSGSSSEGEDDHKEEEGSGEDYTQAVGIRRKYGRPAVPMVTTSTFERDFSELNATEYAGLEVDHDPNAFVNAPLQALFFLYEFRNQVLGLPFSSKPVCIPTELGFLFRLLETARSLYSKDKACQARNFHRAFRSSPDALALGLLSPSKIVNDRRAGAFVRYVFTQFLTSGGAAKDIVDSLFSAVFSARDIRELGNGKKEVTQRELTSYVVDLVDDDKCKTFEETLSHSLRQERKHRSWSDELKAQVNVTTLKTPKSLPLYLILNCAELFKRAEPLPENFMCESFGYVIQNSSVVPMRNPSEPPPAGAEIYDIVGVVSRITDVERRSKLVAAKKKKASKDKSAKPSPPASMMKNLEEEADEFDGHLVTHVKVQTSSEAEPSSPESRETRCGRKIHAGEWLLFNDIKVTTSNLQEALDFSSRFRAPAVLIFKKRVDDSLLPKSVSRYRINPEIFLTPSIATVSKKRGGHHQHPPAAHVALPNVKPGDLVAIDCEFVALSNDVYEVKPDGTKIVTSPRQLALARLSCLALDGRVIMDDYVSVGPEPVVDYLTRFSGLSQGDLDPTTTSRHLLPHRVVYSKLLYLLETGCVFIGHGLSSDFKVVNIVVPPQQMRDTVELFWIKGMRMFSLRFLSSVLLQEDIQDRVHDSIQDASAALKLYQKYLELEESKKLDETLKRLYMEFSTRTMT